MQHCKQRELQKKENCPYFQQEMEQVLVKLSCWMGEPWQIETKRKAQILPKWDFFRDFQTLWRHTEKNRPQRSVQSTNYCVPIVLGGQWPDYVSVPREWKDHKFLLNGTKRCAQCLQIQLFNESKTRAKNVANCGTLGQKSTFYPKIQMLKIVWLNHIFSQKS